MRANSFFHTNPFNRAHLANQFLLYECIAIPTKDFGIVPILIYWLGLKDFERILKAKALYFLHLPSILGYAGNGDGISGFIVQPSKSKSFQWWQDALFGDIAKAVDIQLRYMCPFIGQKQRAKLVTLVLNRSQEVEYNNDFFNKHIKHESYTDIMEDQELSTLVAILSGNPDKIDLTRVSGVDQNQLIVADSDKLTGSADLILRVAEINMTLAMGKQFDDSDVFIPEGGEVLVKSKLARAKVSPSTLENFISLLDLEGMPDPGVAIIAGEQSLRDIWRLRQKKASREFRKWLRTADFGDARELERLYVRSLGRKSFYEALPTRILRFAITKAADIVYPTAGVALEIADSFFVEKWLQGYTPRLFLDQVRKLFDSEVDQG